MIPIQQRRHLECPVSQHDTMEPSSVGPTKMVALSPLYPGYPQKDDLLKFPVVHLFWEPNWPWFSMLMQLSVPVISAKPSWGFTGNSNFWMPQPHFDHAKYRKQALLNQPLWVGQGVTMQISAARACWDHHMAPDGRHTGKTQAFPQVLLLLFFVWGRFTEVTQNRSTQISKHPLLEEIKVRNAVGNRRCSFLQSTYRRHALCMVSSEKRTALRG